MAEPTLLELKTLFETHINTVISKLQQIEIDDKTAIANALTAKGVVTTPDMSAQQMVEKIGDIKDLSRIIRIYGGNDGGYLSGLYVKLFLDRKTKLHLVDYRGGASTTVNVYGYTDSTFNTATRVLLATHTGLHNGVNEWVTNLNGYQYIEIARDGYREVVYFENIWWE